MVYLAQAAPMRSGNWSDHALVALAAIAAGACLLLAYYVVRDFRSRARRRAEQQGRCPVCNYDLRATPRQCPECGTIRGTEGKGNDLVSPVMTIVIWAFIVIFLALAIGNDGNRFIIYLIDPEMQPEFVIAWVAILIPLVTYLQRIRLRRQRRGGTPKGRGRGTDKVT